MISGVEYKEHNEQFIDSVWRGLCDVSVQSGGWGCREQSLLRSHYASYHAALLSEIRKGECCMTTQEKDCREEYCVMILKMAALLETWINVLLVVF